MTPGVVPFLLLAVILVLLEWGRRDRANRAWRVSGAALIAAALVLVAQPVARSGTASPAHSRTDSLFLALHAPTEIDLGESIAIDGVMAVGPGDSALIRLRGPGGATDSARVTAVAPVFALTDTPRAEGAVTYLLEVVRGDAPAAAETLGVAVRRRPPPDLLILDGSPSFETTWLKRWLATRGGRATVRTTISRARFRTDQVNGASGNPARLTPALLESYAAVLADAGALGALSPDERRALEAAIRNRGLGLLVTADVSRAAQAGEPALRGLRARLAGDALRRTARVRWRGAPAARAGTVEVENAQLTLPPEAEVIARDEAGEALAARWSEGAGRVAVTLVRSPSRWVLDGEADRFASYWTSLLGAVVRDTLSRISVVGDPLPRADRRTSIEVMTVGPRPTVAVLAPDGGSDTLALARDPIDPRRLSGAYWPRAAGWHAVRLGERDVPFLVAGPAATGAVADAAGAGGVGPRRIVGFTVLLVSLSLLWAESRRRMGR